MKRMHSKRQGGFTLIEILVAMLVLAIGLLGVAAMQLRGLQYNHDAQLRSQVSILASGIADRMRLNSAGALAGDYNGNYTLAAAAPAGCNQATATSANDLACWRRQAWDVLPIGSVVGINLAAGEFTVTLQPYDRTSNALGNQITFSFIL